MIVRTVVLLALLILTPLVTADTWIRHVPSQDTYVYELTPSIPRGDSLVVSSASMGNNVEQNGLIQWDVTGLAGEVILDACIICYHVDVLDRFDTINLNILTPSFGAWNESTLTWSQTGLIGGADIYPPYIRGDITEFGFTLFHELGGFGVKDIVEAWVNIIPNNGVVFHLFTYNMFGYWTVFSSDSAQPPELWVLVQD